MKSGNSFSPPFLSLHGPSTSTTHCTAPPCILAVSTQLTILGLPWRWRQKSPPQLSCLYMHHQNDLVSQRAGIFQAVGYKQGTPLDAKGPKVTHTHISLPLTLQVNSFVNCAHNMRRRTSRNRAQLPLWLTEKVQLYWGTRERVTYFNRRRRKAPTCCKKR